MTSQRPGAPTPSTSRHVRSLGLSKLRQRKGVSLEDIAEKTKISIRFLRAIEAEEFANLPGGLFNTSYIRQYAAAIGFDEAQLLTQYKHKTDPEEENPSANLRKAPGSETRNWLVRWFGITAEAPRS
jgi:cytoskeletal protein RodZ